MKKIILSLSLALLLFAGVASADTCNQEFSYAKSSSFNDSRVTINFKSSDNKIDVFAKEGYQVIRVELSVEFSKHTGYRTYATGAVSNLDPEPGFDIESARVTVKKVCVDVCSNIDGLQESLPLKHYFQGKNCFQIDVCGNLDGVQDVSPIGYMANNGLCEEAKPTPQPIEYFPQQSKVKQEQNVSVSGIEKGFPVSQFNQEEQIKIELMQKLIILLQEMIRILSANK